MSMIFNGVGLVITGSKILLAKLEKKENVFSIGSLLSECFNAPLSQSTGEIIFLSQLEEVCEDALKDVPTMRVTLPHGFYRTFSFPLDENLTPNDVKTQIKWEISNLFPEAPVERFVSTYFITHSDDNKSVTAIIAERKFLEILFKFALRKNVKIEFFEHPAIAAYNAYSIAEVDFDTLLFAENSFLTLISRSHGKIVKMQSFPLENSSLEEILEHAKKAMQKNSLTVALAGNEITDEIIDTVSSSGGKLAEADFGKFFEEEHASQNNYYPLLSLLGILTRVK